MRHTPRGRGYDEAVHYFHHMEDYWQSVFQNSNGDTDFWSQCAAVAKGVRPRDLWVANASYEGPAVDLVNGDPECSVFGDGENHTFDLCPYGPPAEEGGACPPYPGFPGPEHSGCTYVDETFATHAVGTVTRHVMDPAHPLYMFWVSQRTAFWVASKSASAVWSLRTGAAHRTLPPPGAAGLLREVHVHP